MEKTCNYEVLTNKYKILDSDNYEVFWESAKSCIKKGKQGFGQK